MSERIVMHDPKPHPELDRLLALARLLPPMTKEQIDEQRRSWVIGNMMLIHPEMTREDVIAIMDRVPK